MRLPIHVSCVAALSALILGSLAQASPVIDTNSQAAAAPNTPSFTPTYTVSSTDLINGRTPSASNGDFALELAGGLPVLTNGTFGTITEPGGAVDRTHGAFATAGNTAGTTVTYTLNTAASPLGSNLNSIAVYGGWNDSGRDQQNYQVLYSTVQNPTNFINLTTVNFNPTVPDNTQSASRTIITDTTGLLAIGVGALQFNFLNPENGYTGYAEIDVLGAPTPEPTGCTLLCVGAAALMARRRRRN
jgi:hypothetical protein